jgi:hypothetical protein
MYQQVFSGPERALALLAGLFNLGIGIVFFFLPELQSSLPFKAWPTGIPDLLARFIGAIILGNSAGAMWLATESDWARVRPLALVATVYGTLVAIALLYHLLLLQAPPVFWLYFAFDMPFLIVFYALFLYHEVFQRANGEKKKELRRHAGTLR